MAWLSFQLLFKYTLVGEHLATQSLMDNACGIPVRLNKYWSKLDNSPFISDDNYLSTYYNMFSKIYQIRELFKEIWKIDYGI